MKKQAKSKTNLSDSEFLPFKRYFVPNSFSHLHGTKKIFKINAGKRTKKNSKKTIFKKIFNFIHLYSYDIS
jgi:hypothetical protein